MATYHVATTGDNGDAGSAAAPWADPDYAVSQVSAGDIVIVHEGDYDVAVAMDQAGTSGNPVIFVNAPGEGRWVVRQITVSVDYVWVLGFEIWHDDTTYSRGLVITSAASHCRFEDWYIHHTYLQGIHANLQTGSTDNVFRRGAFHMIGSPSTDGTDNNLVEGLNVPVAPIGITYVDHYLFEYIQCDRAGDLINAPNCQFIIFRNIYDFDFDDSYFADETPGNYHRDIAQPESLDEVTEPTTDQVYEAIFAKDLVEADCHGIFMREYQNDVATRFIVRGSMIHNIGSGAIAAGGTHYFHAYHNTLDRVSQQAPTSGLAAYYFPDVGPFEPVGCSFRNNIVSNSGSGSAVALQDDTAAGVDEAGNLVYNTPVGDITAASTSDPDYDDDANDDLHIPSDSPAVDLAEPITLVNEADGSGTDFDVDDATRFCDGYSLCEGDLIVVGSNDPVRITSITGNNITVASSITWANNDEIYWQGRADSGYADYAASYAFDVALADPTDSETIIGSTKEITLTLTNAAAIRQVELLVDNIPVDLQYDSLSSYSYELDLSGYSNGQEIRIEARAFPLGASDTLYASDVATVTYSTSGGATVWYVNTDVVGGSDDGTSEANAWGTIADALAYFAGLSTGAATADHVIQVDASGGTADTLASFVTYTIDYFYGTEYTLTIQPKPGQGALKTGISTSRYRVAGYGFRIQCTGLVIDNIQFSFTTVDTRLQVSEYDASTVEVKNCYIHGAYATMNYLLYVDVDNAASRLDVRRNIINFAGTDLYSAIYMEAVAGDAFIYNNDIEGQTAVYGGVYIASGYTGDVTIKNNAFVNCDDAVNDAGSSGTVVVDYNAAADDLNTEFSASNNVQPSDITDDLPDYATGNYTLVTGYDLAGAGVGPSADANVAALDIDGDSVSGATCDIGADEVVVTYTVTYDGNTNDSGTAPTDGSSPYEESDTVTVLGNTGNLAKTGYTFDGWNTAANGSGTDYAADATFSMPASNVTLYAQWLLNATSTNNIAATVAKTFAPRLLWRRRR